MMNKAALTLDQVEKVNGGIKIWASKAKYDTDDTSAATATANADDDNFTRIRIM